MQAASPSFLALIERWLSSEPTIKSAVLFGSNAGGVRELAQEFSDYDLHVISSQPDRLEKTDWEAVFPSQDCRFQVARGATGGVRKVTVLFHNSQIDLIIVPEWQARLGRCGFYLRLHRKIQTLKIPLNEMKTCLHSGYRFLKGENVWGGFYAGIAKEMSGVRITDSTACQRANQALVDFLWVLQKLKRGELSAAQYVLHRSLSETNFVLFREFRLRTNQSLPSFGIARRLEVLLSNGELETICVDSRLNAAELERAAWQTHLALKKLMRNLVPRWDIPRGMVALLEQQRT